MPSRSVNTTTQVGYVNKSGIDIDLTTIYSKTLITWHDKGSAPTKLCKYPPDMGKNSKLCKYSTVRA